LHRLRLRKFPFAVQDFGTRAIETDCVVPALHDGQAVRNFTVAAAELDVDRAIGAFSAGDAVD
jgi:hypothetical protein